MGINVASLDIGIDLGTAVIVATDADYTHTLREEAVVAVDARTGKVLAIGDEVRNMIGRTPPHIRVIRPLVGGVVSDFDTTEILIKYLLKKICTNAFVKPRVCICVPSGITSVESQAVIDAAVSAGARKVFLIEEPVAAAIGAGMDISQPNGNLIVDVGGGTTDIAVLSLNGIVCKTSLKSAGMEFDEALIRYMRGRYNLLIGNRTAQEIKMEIGSVDPDSEDAAADIKGRHLLNGLPRKMSIRRSELVSVYEPVAQNIIKAVQGVLEKTPPELVGDIRDNGIVLTGGGAQLGGLDVLMEKRTKTKCNIAENPQDCVAIGTARSFKYLTTLYDGFITPSMHAH